MPASPAPLHTRLTSAASSPSTSPGGASSASSSERTGSIPRTDPVRKASPAASSRSHVQALLAHLDSRARRPSRSLRRGRCPAGCARRRPGSPARRPRRRTRWRARPRAPRHRRRARAGTVPAASLASVAASTVAIGPLVRTEAPGSTSGRSATARSHGGKRSLGSTAAATTAVPSEPSSRGTTVTRRRPSGEHGRPFP